MQKFIVNDSFRMKQIWNQVTFVLEKLAQTALRFGGKGLYLEFTHSRDIYELLNASLHTAIPKYMNNNIPRDTNREDTYAALLESLQDWWHAKTNTVKKLVTDTRRLTIIVLTDGGQANHIENFRSLDSLLSRILKVKRFARLFRIQFVTFGDDKDLRGNMRRWVPNMVNMHGNGDIMSIQKWDGDVYKMLLGSFASEVDVQDVIANNQEEDTTALARLRRSSVYRRFEQAYKPYVPRFWTEMHEPLVSLSSRYGDLTMTDGSAYSGNVYTQREYPGLLQGQELQVRNELSQAETGFSWREQDLQQKQALRREKELFQAEMESFRAEQRRFLREKQRFLRRENP